MSLFSFDAARPWAALAALLLAAPAAPAEDWRASDRSLAGFREASPWRSDRSFEDGEPSAGEDALAPGVTPEDDARGPERLRLFDEAGRTTGRMRRDPLIPGRYDLYDERGRRTGRVESDPLRPGTYELRDENGDRTGRIRRNDVRSGSRAVYDILDERGRRTGQVRENPLIEGRYDVFDESGRRVSGAEAE